MKASRPDEHLLVEASELVLVSAGDPGGPPHEARLRFAYDDGAVYLLAHKDADWYRNVARDQGVVVRIRQRGFRGRARLPDARQRAHAIDHIGALFRRKYGAGALKGIDLGALLPVIIDIQF
ncbi:MAG TPA: hypothetical protein VJ793_07240 [Anaerolineae bacterium]|nr:hypothetical protein [Anaerolineae bacterium]